MWSRIISAVGIGMLAFLCQFCQAQKTEEKPYEDHQILKTSYLNIRTVYITGNKITKDYIVLREVPLKKNVSYSISDILKNIQLARQNLMNTSLFIDVTVDFNNWVNDSLDIHVDVKERWYYFPIPYFKPVDRNLNVWINEYDASLSRVNYGIKFAGKNITGRNDNMNVWLINGYTRQVAFNYSVPYIDNKLTQGIVLDFGYAKFREISYATQNNKLAFYKNDKEFVRENLRFGIGYTYRKASVARHSVKFSYTFDRISDSVFNLNPEYFSKGNKRAKFPELFYLYEYLKVDFIPYPTKGFMWDLSFLKRGASREMNLTQVVARASSYWEIAPRYFFSVQAAAGVKFPFDQPYYNQKLFGFSDVYMRGLEYYVLDGSAGGVARATFRREVWSPRIKTGLKSRSYGVIPFRFFVKLYGDIGYVHNPKMGSNFLNNQLLYTGGVGIDMVTIYDFSIRFEFSFNQISENGLFLHSRTDW